MSLYDRNYIENEASNSYSQSQSLQSSRSEFIKKTYQFLAASLLAATAGAYVGMSMGVGPSLWMLILEIGLLVGLMFAKKNPTLAVVLLFAFTFVSGFTLAPTLNFYLAAGMGSVITQAFLLTTVAFGGLSIFAFNTKKDFSSMGKMLFITLIVVFVAMIINIFMQNPMLQIVIASVCAILFSAYILYDTQNIIRGNYDSPILGAVALYLDIINLFVALLQILGIFNNND